MLMYQKSNQQGFTLLEALIAMLITGGALLGLGVIHLKSLQQSELTAQRSMATIQANDLIDRLWANRCTIQDTTKRNTIVTDWNNSWATNAISVASTKLALQQIMVDRAATFTATAGTNIITYDLVISWSNAKATWHKDSTESATQSLSYKFSIPKCTT